MTGVDDERPRRDAGVPVVCSACGGDGYTAQPQLTVLDGIPQTGVAAAPCTWCGRTGRRRGIHAHD
ncbi:hypothetical protein [Prauserella rugosa]|uniref:hypothetical protein n=1 Tax=Prauserella rugosa TaxID=43354 RepID=UPI00055D0F5B|nr:hypothetical protein [Prauserella rugosa]KMS80236.1 hypothetical protein ACZ91_61450 [Streptomyces regensis]